MALLFANNAATTLSGSLTDSGTTINVSPGDGSLFPSPSGGDTFRVTLYEVDINGDEWRHEVVEVTARATDALTVTRNVEGTGSFSYPSSGGEPVYIECRMTAGSATGFLQAAENLSDLASASTSRTNLGLGTIATQNANAIAVTGGTATGLTFNTSLVFGGTGFRIMGDFSTASSNGLYFQSNTTNSSTYLNAMPSGTGTLSAFRVLSSSDTANTTSFSFVNTGTEGRISLSAFGTGSTTFPFTVSMYGTERMRVDYLGNCTFGGSATSSSLYVATVASSVNYVKVSGAATGSAVTSEAAGTDTNISYKLTAKGTGKVQTTSVALFDKGVQTTKSAIGASDIDLALGNVFTKTISSNTTFTVSNVPSAGTVADFILDITNGGSATITWWSGVKWDDGVAPSLPSSGRSVLRFFTHDGGTTWNAFLLGRNMY